MVQVRVRVRVRARGRVRVRVRVRGRAVKTCVNSNNQPVVAAAANKQRMSSRSARSAGTSAVSTRRHRVTAAAMVRYLRMPPRSRRSAKAVLVALGKRMEGRPLAVAISSGLRHSTHRST